MLWLQGWDHAPHIARRCRESWEEHHPDWKVIALSRENLGDYLDPAAVCGNTPQAKSDSIRALLLKNHGGAWADSSLFCQRSIESWLPEYRETEFFAWERPHGQPFRMISSWFLLGSRGSYLLEAWCQKIQSYWKGRKKAHHYFWFHFLFAELYISDLKFRRIWDETCKQSADGPHAFALSRGMLQPIDKDPELKHKIDAREIPMFKLTNSRKTIEAGSSLDYLFHQGE